MPTYLQSRFSAVRAALLDTIDKFTDADLDYRPFGGAYSVRELMLHIAHEEYGEVQHGITRTLPAWPDAFVPAAFTTTDAIKSKLGEVRGQTEAMLAGTSEEALESEVETPWGARASLRSLLDHVLEHEIHHRAELSLILGLLGRAGLDA
jgi:uncharacterized damage-inducible protein DinB